MELIDLVNDDSMALCTQINLTKNSNGLTDKVTNA